MWKYYNSKWRTIFFYFQNKVLITANIQAEVDALEILQKWNGINEYRIDLQINDFFEGKELIFVVKIFVNKKRKNTIKIKKNYSLEQIRELCNDIIPQNENEQYYFISNDKFIIKKEKDFTILDILQKGEKKSKYNWFNDTTILWKCSLIS